MLFTITTWAATESADLRGSGEDHGAGAHRSSGRAHITHACVSVATVRCEYARRRALGGDGGRQMRLRPPR